MEKDKKKKKEKERKKHWKEYVATVDSVGLQLVQLVKKLHDANPNIDFQLVIEGNAAIPWQKLRAGKYNKDDIEMYKLSYRRALALYQHWKIKGIDLRGYNTEVIIAGSGFNGINRDMQKEDNNKRFIIQIIPKVARPDINTN